MSIHISCTHCAKPLRLNDKLAGRRVRCPQCQTVLQVPPPTPTQRWYVKAEDGQLSGPLSREQLDQWLNDGRLDITCQVLREGDHEWRWADELYPELAAAANAAAADAAADDAAQRAEQRDDPHSPDFFLDSHSPHDTLGEGDTCRLALTDLHLKPAPHRSTPTGARRGFKGPLPPSTHPPQSPAAPPAPRTPAPRTPAPQAPASHTAPHTAPHPALPNAGPAATPDSRSLSDRSRLVAGLLGVFLGPLGVHRFYLGHVRLGLAMLATAGGFGIWSTIDVVLVLLGKVPDAQGRPLR